DEIHTPDSSRWWLRESYASRLAAGQDPDMIDKEFFRLWFRDHCDPYKDETLPEAPESLIVELSSRYIRLFEMITGKSFQVHEGDVAARIGKSLKAG
ncbi:MAG: phosphoribosylaminoimidazolesuccinocarboxamide synthase, partial [Spirochaetia bacterium]|nr:phosphoribosylaminoimidazolesuccinocarboxamide synthase [Spirochaetia bacterium]